MLYQVAVTVSREGRTLGQELHSERGEAAAFVVKTKDALDLEALCERLAGIAGARPEVGKLFGDDEGDLARHAVVRFPAAVLENTTPFDLAYALLDAAGLESAEPLLGAPPPAYPQFQLETPEQQEEPMLLGAGNGDSSGGGSGSSGSSGGYEGNAGAKPDDVEWHLGHMRVPQAWAFSEARHRPAKGKGILIAQPDTGVTDHPALANAIDWTRATNVSEPGTPPTDPLDQGWFSNPGHGTAVCSVASGRGTAGSKHVRGVAPEALVVPVRAVNSVVIGPSNSGYIAAAVEAAIDKGCHVISMSLGGAYEPAALRDAIAKAVQNDIICIAAAGNFAGGAGVTYPGWDSNCVAVAGSTFADVAWTTSCRGPSVAVSAPAAWVYIAWRGKPSDQADLVGPSSGTSYATAEVAGLAALWLAHHGRDALIEQVGRGNLASTFKQLLRETARRPAGWDTANFGEGIVDARALLEAQIPFGIDGDFAAAEAAPASAPEFGARVRNALLERGIEERTVRELDDAFVARFGTEILYLDAYRVAEGSAAPAMPAPPASAALRAALAQWETATGRR